MSLLILCIVSLCSIQLFVGFVEDQFKLYDTLYMYHSLPSSKGVGGADLKCTKQGYCHTRAAEQEGSQGNFRSHFVFMDYPEGQ